MKIYQIIGATGEYEDYTEWVARTFTKELNAKDYLHFLHEKIKELGIENHPTSDAVDKANKKMLPFDKNFRCDYTGVNYSLVEYETED